MVDTSRYPYTSIVYIAVDNGEYTGSGVLIAPDEVLTAAHIADPGGTPATSFQCFPGTDHYQGAAGEVAGTYAHFFTTGATLDSITFEQSQTDFALIHLAHPVTGGTMGTYDGYTGGVATVSGYPDNTALSFEQVNSLQNLTLDPNYSLLHGTTLGAGSSGGPIWIGDANQADVVAVVSSESTDGSNQGNFALITPAIQAQLNAWLAQDTDAPLVDVGYYFEANPDVAAAGASAASHYATSGWHEGRNPDAFFSTVGYLAANPDVKNAGIDPATHYDTSGWKEGRDPGPEFDTRLYLLMNPDVAAAGIDPLQHYLQYGQYEGRALEPAIGPISGIVGDFDREYYLLQNPDVARAGVDPLQHFLSDGWREGRDPNTFFNTRAYLAHSPDVAAAGIDPLRHYLEFGIYEGRAIG